MKSKTILGADGATKMRQITVGIHGKGGEAGIKAIQRLAGMVDSLKQCQTPQEVYDRYLQITLYAFTQFFMPRGRLEYLQATDGVPYDIFVKKGLITLSGENYVDYHDVYGWFTMLLEDYGIRPLKIGYDRYSAQYLITDMANYGFHMDDVYQGENLTPVIREFEGIIKDGDFKIADNNLLKTHFLNVALKHNMETRKFRPIKIEQRAHIDGFVSVIDAMTVRQKYWEECGELLKNAA